MQTDYRMEESHYLNVPHPINIYGICKVWHQGILKVLVANGNRILAATAMESFEILSWNFDASPVLTLPDKCQIISITAANPLVVSESKSVDTKSKVSRRCIIGVTYCIPPPPESTPPSEPEPVAPAKPAIQRPSGPNVSYLSRVLPSSRPPTPVQKPIEIVQAPLPPRFFLSLFGTNSSELDDWNLIASDQITFELPYAPFVLAKYAPPNSSSVVFMLSGADKRLHVFNQTAEQDNQNQANDNLESTEKDKNNDKTKEEDEEPKSETNQQTTIATPENLLLPLLDQYPSPVVTLDILEAHDGRIHVVAGCQDGSVILTSGDSQGNILHQCCIVLDGPITSVKIYQLAKNRMKRTLITTENDQTTTTLTHSSVRRLYKHISREMDNSTSTKSSHSHPSNMMENGPSSNHDITFSSKFGPADSNDTFQKISDEFAVNIVVGSAVGFAVVFRDVVENHFDDPHLLPDSDKHDAVLSLSVADFDHDGHVEILVGTYGQRLLAYAETKGSWSKQKPRSSLSKDPVQSISQQRLQSRLESTAKRTETSLDHNATNQNQNTPNLHSEQQSISASTQNSDSNNSTNTTANVARNMAKIIAQNHEEVLLGLRDNVPSSLMPTAKLTSSNVPTTNIQNTFNAVDFSIGGGVREDVRTKTDSLNSLNTPTSSLLLGLSPNTNSSDFSSDDEAGLHHNHSFSLLWHQTFAHPLYGIMCDDFTNDGIYDVVTGSLYGLHLLRPEINTTRKKLVKRLQLLSDIVKLERALHRKEKQRNESNNPPAHSNQEEAPKTQDV